MGYPCIYQKYPTPFHDTSTSPRPSHKNQMIWSLYHTIPRYGIDTPYSRPSHTCPIRSLKGHASRSTRTLTHTRLTVAQEQALYDYIDRLDHIEYAVRLKHIRGAVEYILKIASDPESPPKALGKDWVTRFLKRHPKYHKRKQKPLSAERKNAHDVQGI